MTTLLNIFNEVNGEKILFEQADSLFQRINKRFGLKINREALSNNFEPEELHQDIIDLFDKLKATLG